MKRRPPNLVYGRAVQVGPTQWQLAMEFGTDDYIDGVLELYPHLEQREVTHELRASSHGAVSVRHLPEGVSEADGDMALRCAVLDGRIKCDPYLHNLLDLSGTNPRI